LVTNEQNKYNPLNLNLPTQVDLNRFYLSQGFAKNKASSNDCGPTCTAMVCNVLMELSGLKVKRITQKEVISRIPSFGRVPGWIPRVGGATAPWGLATAFNQLAREYQLPWQAERIRNASIRRIQKIIRDGGYASFLRFWENGGAHWTNILGLTADQRQFVLLDPNPYLGKRKRSERVLIADASMILPDWQRQPWWAALLGLKNEIIRYSKVNTGR
jgi:hypothetical protein